MVRQEILEDVESAVDLVVLRCCFPALSAVWRRYLSAVPGAQSCKRERWAQGNSLLAAHKFGAMPTHQLPEVAGDSRPPRANTCSRQTMRMTRPKNYTQTISKGKFRSVAQGLPRSFGPEGTEFYRETTAFPTLLVIAFTETSSLRRGTHKPSRNGRLHYLECYPRSDSRTKLGGSQKHPISCG